MAEIKLATVPPFLLLSSPPRFLSGNTFVTTNPSQFQGTNFRAPSGLDYIRVIDLQSPGETVGLWFVASRRVYLQLEADVIWSYSAGLLTPKVFMEITRFSPGLCPLAVQSDNPNEMGEISQALYRLLNVSETDVLGFKSATSGMMVEVKRDSKTGSFDLIDMGYNTNQALVLTVIVSYVLASIGGVIGIVASIQIYKKLLLRQKTMVARQSVLVTQRNLANLGDAQTVALLGLFSISYFQVSKSTGQILIPSKQPIDNSLLGRLRGKAVQYLNKVLSFVERGVSRLRKRNPRQVHPAGGRRGNSVELDSQSTAAQKSDAGPLQSGAGERKNLSIEIPDDNAAGTAKDNFADNIPEDSKEEPLQPNKGAEVASSPPVDGAANVVPKSKLSKMSDTPSQSKTFKIRMLVKALFDRAVAKLQQTKTTVLRMFEGKEGSEEGAKKKGPNLPKIELGVFGTADIAVHFLRCKAINSLSLFLGRCLVYDVTLLPPRKEPDIDPFQDISDTSVSISSGMVPLSVFKTRYSEFCQNFGLGILCLFPLSLKHISHD